MRGKLYPTKRTVRAALATPAAQIVTSRCACRRDDVPVHLNGTRVRHTRLQLRVVNGRRTRTRVHCHGSGTTVKGYVADRKAVAQRVAGMVF